MLNFKSVSQKTYERNIASGKWQFISGQDGRYLIRVVAKSRGVYNSAGRLLTIEVPLINESFR